MLYYFHYLPDKLLNNLLTYRANELNNIDVDELHIFYMKTDDERNRLALRKVLNRNKAWVVLISEDANVIELSWKTGVNYFIKATPAHENLNNLLQRTIDKLLEDYNKNDGKKLRIKSLDRIDYISPKDILYILGDGNYSKIIYNENEILVSKNLKSLEESLKDIRYLNRYGKSVILNINKITSIEGRKISFENGKNIAFPKYSTSFKDLKNQLLWKTV